MWFWPWHGKKADQKTEAAPKKRKKSIIWRICKYFFIFILLVLICACAGGYWLTQTTGGQAWLVKTVNSALAKKPGLRFTITHLSGSLPFRFSVGIEAADDDGIWLKAPQTDFALDWRALPKKLQLDALRSVNVDISRFPNLPKEEEKLPPEPEKPLTIEDAGDLLRQAAQFMEKPPRWMPEIQLNDIGIENALLPQGLINPDDPGRLRCDLNLMALFASGELSLKADARARNSGESIVKLPGIDVESSAVNIEANVKPTGKDSGLDANALLKIAISETSLDMAPLPADFLGKSPLMELNLHAGCEFPQNDFKAFANISGPNLDAGHVALKGGGGWQSGPQWARGDLDGKVKYDLALNVEPVPVDVKNPDALLNILRSPATLKLAINGDLPKTDVNLEMRCDTLEKSGHVIKDTILAISARDVAIPLNIAAMEALETENHFNLAFNTLVDSEKVDLSTEIFFQALSKGGADARQKPDSSPAPSADDWRAGLRNLRLEALGITGSGDVAALVAGKNMPALDGDIKIGVQRWDSIAKFIPGQKLAGNVAINVSLASNQDNSPKTPISSRKLALPFKSGGAQNVRLNIDIPAFSMLPEKGGDGVSVKNLTAKASLDDVFKNPMLDCDLDVGALNAAGLNLKAGLKANGPIGGPLNLDLQSSGDVKAKLAAGWEPGKAALRTLDASADLSKFTGQKGQVGLRLQSPAEITYGDNGIHVSGLDLNILPSGKLAANGGVGKDKLDFNLALENLRLKAWQSIVPALPAGAASIKASLRGTPARPGGGFQATVSDLLIPQSNLPPITATLAGDIINWGAASALNARLELDPKTQKLLGGGNALIQAGIPLSFGANGIPGLNMTGPLSATVRWNGAIGPIWNLLPMADQRLNGRINIDIKAGGTPQKPAVNGGVKINGARYENLLLGVLITDINVDLNLAEHSGLGRLKQSEMAGLPGGMTLTMSASDGRGGTVKVNGKGALDGKNLDIAANIDRLKPLRRRDVHIELSGDAKVTGSATAPVVNGEIIVNRGEVLLNNLAIAGSVTTLPITEPATAKNGKSQKAAPQAPAKPVANATADSGRLNVRIRMLPRFSVTGRGLTSLWQANLLIEGTPENPLVTGSINSVKGNFDFLGKIFVLTRGIVRFAGGSLANPLLDIELTNETPDVTAHILVTGPVNKMQINLSSEPSMPRDEIISYVLFGKSVSDLTRMEALQLAAAVAQLAGFGGGGVLDFAKKALGVDVLRVGTSGSGGDGELGDQTSGGTTIEMGKYINDFIYMGVQQGLKPDSTAFIIELELTPRTNLELKTEQNNTWGGIKWKMNY